MAQTKVTSFYSSRKKGNIQSLSKRKLPLTDIEDGHDCMYRAVFSSKGNVSVFKEIVSDVKNNEVSFAQNDGKPISTKKPKSQYEIGHQEKSKSRTVSFKSQRGRSKKLPTKNCQPSGMNLPDIRQFCNSSKIEDFNRNDEPSPMCVDDAPYVDIQPLPKIEDLNRNEAQPSTNTELNLGANKGKDILLNTDLLVPLSSASQDLKTPSKRGVNNLKAITPSKRQKRTHDPNNVYDDAISFTPKQCKESRKRPQSARKLLLQDSTSDNASKAKRMHTVKDQELFHIRPLDAELLQVNSTLEDTAKVQQDKQNASETEINDIVPAKYREPLTLQILELESNFPKSASKPKCNKSLASLEKLTPEQVKLKLQKCGKLTELKERLAMVNKYADKVKESRLSNEKSTINTTDTNLSEHNNLSGNKRIEELKTRPAYERFHNLAHSSVPSLTLPYQYKILAETFHCCDVVVSILHNRREVCTFDKLKKSVEDMMKRSFDKLKLGQIRTVFPLAYYFTYETEVRWLDDRSDYSKFKLVIGPNFDYVEKDEADMLAEQINKTTLSNKNRIIENIIFTVMKPSHLIERRAIFAAKLLEMTKKHHEKFLAGLKTPIKVSSEKLKRWHPRFPLDEVPDIISSRLPQSPGVQQYSTAQDVLQKIRGTVGKKVEQALESVAKAHEDCKEVSNTQNVPGNDKINTGILKGVSLDLLQKIRAKEAALAVKEMTRSPAQERRLKMMSSLPEMIRILRTYFITERRAAVHIEDAMSKIAESYHSPLTPEQVQEHLHLAAELLPKWLFLITIRKGLFLKIDKNADIQAVIEEVKNAIDMEKQCFKD